MPNLVNLETVTAHVPGDASRVLLDRVSLGVESGDRIGVVGLNGGGKTTLLEVMTGQREPDSGRVSAVRGLRSAVVTQRTELPPGARVRDVVLASLGVTAEHEWASVPRVREVLAGLGIDDLERTVDGMSGGERRRVALAGIVSGSGPTCAFLCSDEASAIRVAAELAGVGVCRGVRVAHGPVPGARVVEDPEPASSGPRPPAPGWA